MKQKLKLPLTDIIKLLYIDIKNNSEKIFLFLILAFLPLVIEKDVTETFLNNFWVNPIMSKVKDKFWLVDTVIVVLIIAIFRTTYLRINKRYRVSINSILLSLLITLWYLIARYYLDYSWTFKTSAFIGELEYACIIVFSCLTIPSLLLYATCLIHESKKNESKKDNSKGFIQDLPLNKENPQDTLGRKGFADSIAKTIQETTHLKQSFAIGITGSWGSGKTSFLNLIQKSLTQENKTKEKCNIKTFFLNLFQKLKTFFSNLIGKRSKQENDTENKYIIIEFNPWQSNSPNQIINDFFNILKGKLKKYNGELNNTIQSYVNQLLSIESNLFTKISKLGLSYFFNEKNTQQLFDSINETIEKLDKKLVIFIDDLDRLDKKEVIEVIRLIRNTANFKNTFFIVAYDRNYVLNAIKSINEYRNEFFLEKIFQLEVNLPVFETDKIYHDLKEKLKKVLPSKFEEEIDKIVGFGTVYLSKDQNEANWHHLSMIKSVRDINRLINSFSLIANQLVDKNGDREVILKELFLLEILRFKYPSIYNLVGQNPTKVLDFRSFSDYSHYVYESSKNSSFFEKNKEALQIPSYHESDINKLLECIFHGMEEWKKPSIKNPLHFPKYFAYRIMTSNISIIELTAYRKGTQSNFFEWVDKSFKSGKGQALVNELLEIESTKFVSIDDYEKVIRSIFYSCSRYFSQVELFRKKDKIVSLLSFQDYIYKDRQQHRRFVRQLFEDAEQPYVFEASILEIYNTYSDGMECFQEEEKFDILEDYLFKYLSKNKRYDKNINLLLGACQRKNGTSLYYSDEVKNKIKDSLAFNNIEDFFKEILYEESPGKYCLSSSHITEVFDSTREFKKHLEQLNQKHNNDSISMMINFLSEYLEGNGDAITFNFDFM